MAPRAIKRVRYYERQYLGVRDFQDEQAYHIGMRRRHLIGQHSWGIVRGLEITKDVASLVWSVQPGMAIDGFGREIVLLTAAPLDTAAIADELRDATLPAQLHVWLAYRVDQANLPAPGAAGCENAEQGTRIHETYRLLYQNSPAFAGGDPRKPATWPRPARELPDDPAAAPWPLYLGTLTWGNDPANPARRAILEVTASAKDDPADAEERRRRYVGLVGADLATPDPAGSLAVHAQTSTFDRNVVVKGTLGDGAGQLRLDLAKDKTSVITNVPAATADVPAPESGDIYLRTSKDTFIHIDQNTLKALAAEIAQNLSVGGTISVKQAVGDAGKLQVAVDSDDLAVLTRPADKPGAPSHNLALRTNDGAGGNTVLIDKDKLEVKQLAVAEATSLGAGLTLAAGKHLDILGGQIAFRDAGGGEGGDPIRIARQRQAAGRHDLQLQIGDEQNGVDRLVVGPVTSTNQFVERFVVKNNGDTSCAGSLSTQGNLTVAGSITGGGFTAGGLNVQGDITLTGQVDGRDIAADGAALDGMVATLGGISPGAKEVAVLTGELADGGTIPLPIGFTAAQCQWIVSPKLLDPPAFDINEIDVGAQFKVECAVDANRGVTVKWWQLGHATTLGFQSYGGTANYLVIGIK